MTMNHTPSDPREPSDLIVREKVPPAEAKPVRTLIARALAQSGPLTDDNERLAMARAIAPAVWAAFPALDRVVTNLLRPGGAAAAVVEGFDIRGRCDVEEAKILELTLALALGNPFGFTQQNSGALVSTLQPTPGQEMKQNGLSRQEFHFHTDDLIQRASLRSEVSEFISLLGVVNEGEAVTGLALADEVFRKLDAAPRRVLEQSRFVCRSSENYPYSCHVVSPPMAVLTSSEAGEILVGYAPGMQPADPNDTEARDALAQFREVAESLVHQIPIRPGSWLVFRNDRLVHKRSEITGDRLVLRSYVRRSLWQLMRATGSPGPIFDARLLMLSV